ncbi:hypothetical protein [Thalassotalea sediminis]|uniref:hypothetical protein n=1 Tax=Thalassotalea sediminis TaxID=1759089 RepID=UPI00257391A9|nr:hypothetical protein [Thalassotalea sediminis]
MLSQWHFSNGFDDGVGNYFFADDSQQERLYIEGYTDLFADKATIPSQQSSEFLVTEVAFIANAVDHQSFSFLNNIEILSFDNVILEQLQGASVTFELPTVPCPHLLNFMQ